MYKKLKTLLYAALFGMNFLFTHVCHSKNIWIIVHGTFANKAAWHQPEGEFFTTLYKVTQATIYSFTWSGKLSASARLTAGIALKDFIVSIAQPHDKIHIIAHSHGGNVSIIAATYLSHIKSPLYIHELILLATPIPIKLLKPDMYRIKKLYNFFSYGDKIQPVLQRFKRVFADHPTIFNIQLRIQNFCPTHTGMHDPLIAYYAPHLEKLLENSSNCVLMHITSQTKIHIEHDATRTQDLDSDNKFIPTMIEIFNDPYRSPFKNNQVQDIYPLVSLPRYRYMYAPTL